MSEPSSSGFSRLEWQRWPLRENPQAGLRIAGVGLLVLLIEAALILSLPPLTALALGLLLAMALLPYFLPRQYKVSGEGLVVVRGFFNDRRTWAEFQTYRIGQDGYWLLPDPGGKPNGLKPGAFYLARPADPQVAQALEVVLASRF